MLCRIFWCDCGWYMSVRACHIIPGSTLFRFLKGGFDTYQAVCSIAAAGRATALAVGWDVAGAGGVCVQPGRQSSGERQVVCQAGGVEALRHRHALHSTKPHLSTVKCCPQITCSSPKQRLNTASKHLCIKHGLVVVGSRDFRGGG